MTQGLYWSIAAVAVALLPHLSVLPYWVLLFCAATAAWRIVIEVRALRLPPRWFRIVLSVFAIAAVATAFRTLNGLEAGTALLATMAGAKLLETRGARDCTMLIFIGFILLFAALLFDQSLLRLPYVFASAWFLVAALLCLHRTSQPTAIRSSLSTAGKILLQAAPITLLLFLFFPRLPGQFWALPSRTQAATGLSDEMSPGEISQLTDSGEVAFRVKFDGAVPPPAQRYWRGPVLHEFDGRRWRRGPIRGLQNQNVAVDGPTFRYRITLEPTQRTWILALDMPTQWPEQASRMYDLQLVARRPITAVSSFDLESRTDYRTTSNLSRTLRAIDLALPGNANPRSRTFAKELRANSGSDLEFIQALLTKFRREEFYYTLTPPRSLADPVDDFLFNTRRGFCEHFASAFTTLLRAANIPARVVTGYQGGEYNSLGDYLLVRQSDAHAWTEVWLEERGWVRVDPTAAVAPERIEKNLDLAISQNDSVPGRFLRTNRFFAQARLTWDAVNNFWNNQIVEYDELKQRALLALVGVDSTDWRQIGIVFTAALVAFFAVLTAYLSWQYRPRNRDPIAVVYERLCRRLARAQIEREPHEGPVDYLRRAALAQPQWAATLSEACFIYVGLRYGAAPRSVDLLRLKALVRQLSSAVRAT